jgi:prepilin-type processing-associated H-X9-DG protein
MAVSLPVFHSVRERAKSTTCQGNIRQLLLEFQQYEAANETLPYGFAALQSPPPPGGYLSNMAIDLPGWYWPNYLGAVQQRSLGDWRVLQCPAKHLESPWLERSVLSGNYGVNRSLCRSAFDTEKYLDAFGGPALSTATIRRPGATLLLVDSGYALISWWHVCDDPVMEAGTHAEDTAYIPGMELNKKRIFAPGQVEDAMAGRHPNKTVNVGFVDGHVDTRKADSLLVEKTAEGTYANLRSLWESE